MNKGEVIDEGEAILSQIRADSNSVFPDSKDSLLEHFYIACVIIHEFLGVDWFDKYVQPHITVSKTHREKESGRRAVEAAFRVIDLAEVLFNLQHIQGYDDCIKRMQQGDIEGTLAELDLGRMLYLNNVSFRYVTRHGVKGADYDLEIIYPDGTVVCADAKCKVGSTNFSEAEIRNALFTARKQLPGDQPGVVFIKSPQHWLDIPELAAIQKRIALEFLRGTGRIVSVKFYISHVFTEDDLMHFHQGWLEVNNPWNRFDAMRNWDLFHIRDLHSTQHRTLHPWHEIFPRKNMNDYWGNKPTTE